MQCCASRRILILASAAVVAVLSQLIAGPGSQSLTQAEPPPEASPPAEDPVPPQEPAAPAAELTPEQMQFFENEVRPILAENCWGCHGEEKQRGSLRLDSRAHILLGGDTGPAVEPDYPEDSLLLEAVNYESFAMPPDGQLPEEQIASLTRWVEMGAPWPGADGADLAAPLREEHGLTEEDRQWWSFQPVAVEALPAPTDPTGWCANEIDQFVLAQLQAAGFEPSPPAERRELIRRAYFDLTGLPPTAQEIAAFVADERPEAYAELIDRLLESPHYGERWGRHWLDVVRFAETNGYERDNPKPEAWRYRDYVIGAFNADLPYDQFIREQLAGDELVPLTDEGLTATGFYRLGVWDDEPDDPRQAEFDGLDDILATTGTTFLGLTVGCARCHDHKFDPISHEDYHSLLAFMRGVTYFDNGTHRILSDGRPVLTVMEGGSQPPPTHVLIRGDSGNQGEEVQPRYLPVMFVNEEAALPVIPAPSEGAGSSGRRLALAQWIASPENPLTARVMVNRLWHWHFGRGIVPTPSDFGHTGLPPTHPLLLDWLAQDFQQGGWQLKRMHRQIMLSSTYRQSSRVTEANRMAEAQDPGNELLWRQNMRRLEAEAIRDAVLVTSGQLNEQLGGPSYYPHLAASVLSTASRGAEVWPESSPEDRNRRSVYIIVKRTLRVPMMELFDAASPDSPIGNRVTTTIAPQALMLLNSEFMTRQSNHLAQRLVNEVGEDPTAQIARAYELALGRTPSESERSIALSYLTRTAETIATQAKQTVQVSTPLSLPDWSTYGGQWSLGEGTELHVESALGGKAVWNSVELADGEVRCQVMLMDQTGDAGLLLRVSAPREGTDQLTAYNINVRPNALRLGKHEDSWRVMNTVPVDLAVGQWHTVRVKLEGGHIQVFLGEEAEPRIDFVDEQPLPPGQVGFRNFQVSSAFRDLRVVTPSGVFEPEMTTPAPDSYQALSADHRHAALSSLCRMIMNLNEFLYID